MENKIEKKTKQRKGWIKILTEYEKSIFDNMLNEAIIAKGKKLKPKERREVMFKSRDIVRALREANRIKNNKDNVVPEQKIVRGDQMCKRIFFDDTKTDACFVLNFTL